MPSEDGDGPPLCSPASSTTAPSNSNGIPEDVLEVFSPPRLVPICVQKGLTGTLSIDLTTGFDLMKQEVRDWVLEQIDVRRPAFVITSAPCTWFSALNRLYNMGKMKPEKKALKEREAEMLFEFGLDCCKTQAVAHRFYLHEHPATASSWKRPSVISFIRETKAMLAKFDQCEFGLRSKVHGKPMKNERRS